MNVMMQGAIEDPRSANAWAPTIIERDEARGFIICAIPLQDGVLYLGIKHRESPTDIQGSVIDTFVVNNIWTL